MQAAPKFAVLVHASRLARQDMAAVYSGLLTTLLENDFISPDDVERLAVHRVRHNVSDNDHADALRSLGYSAAEYDKKVSAGEEVEAYVHVLTATLLEGPAVVGDEEGAKIAAYRSRHAVSDSMHLAALKEVGMTPEEFESACAVLPPYGVDSYREKLRTALASGSGIAAADEVALTDFRALHGITDELHAEAIEGLGLTAVEYESKKRGQLRGKLVDLERENARARTELVETTGALQVALSRLVDGDGGAEAVELQQLQQLQQELDATEHAVATLHDTLEARESREDILKEMAAAREEELREMSEAVEAYEGRVHARDRELAAVGEQLRLTEEAILSRQRELRRLESVGGIDALRLPYPTAGDASVGRGATSEQARDDEVDRRALVEAARARGVGGSDEEAAGYVHFHTVAMSFKLSLCDRPCLLNRRIDELWEEAQLQRVPRSQWRSFLQARLVNGPIPAATRPVDPGKALLGAVLSLGEEVREVFARVGKDVEGVVRDVGASLPQVPLGSAGLLPGLPRPANSADSAPGPDAAAAGGEAAATLSMKGPDADSHTAHSGGAVAASSEPDGGTAQAI